MLKLIYFIIAMFIAVIIIPLSIVKVFGYNKDEIKLIQKKQVEENSINLSEEKDLKIKKTYKETKIKVKMDEKIVEMDLDEYIKGVVAAEMPAKFEVEALKAQAIAARTFAMGRQRKVYSNKEDMHKDADICTDFGHCQAWISKKEALMKWKEDDRELFWEKISNVVEDTKNEIIKYNGIIANPLYHSNSGGITENAKDVWQGVEVPYLVSVSSVGEDLSPSFQKEEIITKKEFLYILKNNYLDLKINEKDLSSDIKIIEKNESQRVKSIKVGNRAITGSEFRKLFKLRSTNFELSVKGENIEITTKGHGHGVGMSQWGANYLAKEGKNYKEILKHYYKGIEFGEI